MGMFSFFKVDSEYNVLAGEKCGLLSPQRNLYPNIYGVYDGYGRVNGLDAYFMLAMWNRKWCIENCQDIANNETGEIRDAYFDSNVPEDYFISYEKLRNNIKNNADLCNVITNRKIESVIRGIGIELYFSSKKYPYKLRFVAGDNPNGVDHVYYDPQAKYEDYPDNVASSDDPNQGWTLTHKDKGTFLGYCSNCGVECWSEEGAYEDDDGGVYCSSSCAEEYHEYDEVDD